MKYINKYVSIIAIIIKNNKLLFFSLYLWNIYIKKSNFIQTNVLIVILSCMINFKLSLPVVIVEPY